jgi:hypothetical protein
MYRVVRRTGDIFGDEPHVCEFVCDTSDDVATLPTSIAEGTGGKSKYDNQKCSAGSTAIIAINSGSNSYILNNSDVWIAQSSGSSGSGGSSGEDTGPKIYPLDTNGMPTGDVTISEGITRIGSNGIGNYGPFEKNAKVTSIKLPKSMTEIGDYAFSECTNLTSVIFPKNCNITRIASYAFNYTSLKEMRIPDLITEIGNFAFGYSGVNTINFGNANVSLRSNVFYKSGLENINFGVGNILLTGGNIFSYCTGLISVFIPANVTFSTNTSSIFYNDTKLESIVFDDSHQTDFIPASFANYCSALKTFVFPPAVKTIKSSAFCYSGLENLVIPEGVTMVEQSAFSYMNSLTSVTLPSSLTSIKYSPGANADAFQCSKAITTVNLGEGFMANLSLATQVALSQESVADIASKLYDYTDDTNTHKICFNAAVYDAIPEDVMAVFTAKNWTVERSTST